MCEDLEREYQRVGEAEFWQGVTDRMSAEELLDYNGVLFSAHSCGIEGNSYTMSDTRTLKGLSLGKPLVETMEMLDHFHAYEFMTQTLRCPTQHAAMPNTARCDAQHNTLRLATRHAVLNGAMRGRVFFFLPTLPFGRASAEREVLCFAPRDARQEQPSDLSALENNVLVVEILEAAIRSAGTGRAVKL